MNRGCLAVAAGARFFITTARFSRRENGFRSRSAPPPGDAAPRRRPAEAREVFASLAPLPAGSAERTAAENRVAGAFETPIARTLLAAGASWPGLLTWDDRRTVDYLAARADVDPARIGCIGLSGGGLRAACLAAADPRIRATCVVAWMSTLGEMLPATRAATPGWPGRPACARRWTFPTPPRWWLPAPCSCSNVPATRSFPWRECAAPWRSWSASMRRPASPDVFGAPSTTTPTPFPRPCRPRRSPGWNAGYDAESPDFSRRRSSTAVSRGGRGGRGEHPPLFIFSSVSSVPAFDSRNLHVAAKSLIYRKIQECRSGRVYNTAGAAPERVNAYFGVFCRIFGGGATLQQFKRSRSSW
jgi:hypothetical protein